MFDAEWVSQNESKTHDHNHNLYSVNGKSCGAVLYRVITELRKGCCFNGGMF